MRQRRADASRGAGPRLRRLPLSLAFVGLGAAAQQSSVEPARLVAFEPRLSVQQTLTDNHLPGAADGGADAITRATAGLGWRGRTGLVRGFFDYALTGVAFAKHSDRNELQNALNANVQADVVEDRLQFNGAAAIARSAISAFGPQPGGAGDNSNNVAETRTLRLGPVLRGPLGRSLRYTASVTHNQISTTARTSVGDSSSTNAVVRLEPSERARLGWTLDAARLESSFRLGRKTRSDRVYGSLSYEFDLLDLRLSASAGTESANITTVDSRRYDTWGVGLRWTPSPRTLIQADIEERFFGRSHQLVVEYRLPRTVFGLRSGRTLSTTGSQLIGQRSFDFNTFFNSPELKALYPDDAIRAAQVRERMLSIGLNPDAPNNVDFLRSAATLQDRLELSMLWSGLRQTVLLSAARTSTRRVDAISSAFDDLALVDRIRSSSLTLNVSHRLTPVSTLTFQLGAQQSSSDRAGLSSNQQQALLLVQTRLTPDSTATFTLRRAHYNTTARSTDETAVLASYGVRF